MFTRIGEADLILFGANSTVYTNKLGQHGLVMGGGSAKTALQCFPNSDKVFGEILFKSNLENGYFGLMIPYQYEACYKQGTVLGAIQSKVEVRNDSTLGLVEYSVKLLQAMAHNWNLIVTHPLGAGLGGLSMQDVMPLMEQLPDNVEVWTYPNQNVAKSLKIAENTIEKLIGKDL